MKKLYLITGAAGHLGTAVTKLLVERGESVRALLLNNERMTIEPVTCFYGDVRDVDSMRPFFTASADTELIVIHCAGIVTIASKFEQRVWDVNVTGTQNVVDLCREYHAKKLVYISSVHAIPELPKGKEISETDTFDPDRVNGLYAKSKAAATAYVLNAAREGLDASVVHPSGICGPYDKGHGHITSLVIDYCRHKLTAGVDGGYDFVDVRDVAQGVASACENGRRGECYILSNKYVRVSDLLDTLSIVTGLRKVKNILPLWFAKSTARLAETYYRIRKTPPLYTSYSLYTLSSNADFSHDKAARELGYTTRDFRQTLSDTVEWLINQGVLAIKPKKRAHC